MAIDTPGNLAFALVAICREHGVTDFLTEDRDFARFGTRARSASAADRARVAAHGAGISLTHHDESDSHLT